MVAAVRADVVVVVVVENLMSNRNKRQEGAAERGWVVGEKQERRCDHSWEEVEVEVDGGER